jgi:hypothetical protein
LALDVQEVQKEEAEMSKPEHEYLYEMDDRKFRRDVVAWHSCHGCEHCHVPDHDARVKHWFCMRWEWECASLDIKKVFICAMLDWRKAKR